MKHILSIQQFESLGVSSYLDPIVDEVIQNLSNGKGEHMVETSMHGREVKIKFVYDFPSFGLVWTYAPASSPTSGPTAISGSDLPIFYASFFESTWVLNYEYYYLSPPDPGFQFDIPFGGLNDTEISNGTFTYNSYGANIKFEISDDPNYSCFSG